MKRVLLTGVALLFGMSLATQASAQEWQLRMAPLGGDDWAALKFNTETGESWRAYGGDWVPCEEPGEVPAGTYDVIIVPSDAEHSWYAIRLNTETGQGWSLGGGNWHEMANGEGGESGAGEAEEEEESPPPRSSGK